MLTQWLPCPARRDLEKLILSGRFGNDPWLCNWRWFGYISLDEHRFAWPKALGAHACLLLLCQASMALPKLIFLHPSQLCWHHFWVPVPSFCTLMTSASLKVVLQWCSASCWWSCFPGSLQWWSVTEEDMTALVRLRSALCLIHISAMQCPYKQGWRWRAAQSKASGREVHQSGSVFCLLGLSLICCFVPLQVLPRHWQSHIWLEATWSILNKGLCTWNIELMGLVFYM